MESEFQTKSVFNVPLRDDHVKDFKQKQHAVKKKTEREGNGSFFTILAEISKYPDCYSVVKMLPEILCHFGASKHERQIKTNAKKPNARQKVPAMHQSPPLSFTW